MISSNMDYTITSYHLFAAATIAYMLAGLFCAYTRWNHICRPYDEDVEYYYPGRQQITFFFSAQILLFPYLLAPHDGNTWLYVRLFAALYYPLAFSLLLHRYFRKQPLFYSRLDSVGFVVAFAFLLGVFAVVLISKDNLLTAYEIPILWTAGAINLLLTARLCYMSIWLKRKIDCYHYANYSNDEDFPYKFAKHSIIGILLWVVMMDSVFITGNQWVKFVCDIIFTAWQVFFLNRILYPQVVYRTSNTSNAKFPDDEDAPNIQKQKADVSETARAMVLEVMLKKYKKPHLQKSEVLEAIPKGMKKDANAFILQIGYYNLVNMFRLQHARLYHDSKPLATQDDIAEASGYTTRFAFYRARKNEKHIDQELVKDVTL